MLRVRDIMTRDVLCLASDSTVDHAMWSLTTNGISGAPVRTPDGQIVGVLSKSDLVDPFHRGRITGETPVERAMTPIAWSVHPDVPAIDAVRLMLRKGVHRVLVVRAPGHIEGIVTTMDVLRALADAGDFGDVRRPPQSPVDTDAASA